MELSNSAITDWKKGKGRPSIDAIIKISKYFNITSDWLLTGNNSTQQDSSIENLQNPETAMLFKVYNSLDEKKQHIVLQKALELANEE